MTLVLVFARPVRAIEEQPTTLEARVKSLEAQVARLSTTVTPMPLRWDAATGKEGVVGGSEEFPAGATDTVSVLQVKFAPGRFKTRPVVVVTARWKNGDWIGGNKDSFAVTTFNVTNTGFSALLRRVDPSGKAITSGVLLDWIAVEANAAR